MILYCFGVLFAHFCVLYVMKVVGNGGLGGVMPGLEIVLAMVDGWWCLMEH